MHVTKDYIEKNSFSRPGSKRLETLLIIMHWTGNAGQSASMVREYFERLRRQNGDDAKPDRYASAHYVVGLDGEILQLMPEDEVAYHCGGTSYTEQAREYLGTYCSATSSPNWCTLGIELCHPDWTGIFNTETLESAAELCSALCYKNNLSSHAIWRHHDITGKRCPKHWVDNPVKLDEFQLEVDITLMNYLRRAEYGEMG